MAERQVDILIVGGGIVGALFMLALQTLGYQVLLVDEKPLSNQIDEHFDARSLALSPASIDILSMLGIWSLLEAFATPIHTVHVSQQGSFGSTRIERKNDSTLGYVVEMQHLCRVLYARLHAQHMLTPATFVSFDKIKKTAVIMTENGSLEIKTKLLVAADGMNSTVRQSCGLTSKHKVYQQHAIVANIGLSKPHKGVAYERFTSTGPIAFLPIHDQRVALVWVLPSSDIERYLMMDEASFLSTLQGVFGYRLGRLNKVGKRVAYPLQQAIMPKQVVDDFVIFIGNAAHTLHPIAGQGFNLSLRDVAVLAECIAEYGITQELFASYQKMRQHDQQSITFLTNGLVALFTCQIPGLSMLRSAGLMVVDNMPAIKDTFSRYAQGYAGISPDLVCGIPLCRKDV